MKRQGFTLIEVMLSLVLLGIISVIVLPSVQGSYDNIMTSRRKSEMIYLGESTIEKIKGFKENSSSMDVYDMSVEDIIDSFKLSNKVDISLPKAKSSEKYIIEISKDIRGEYLWVVDVNVIYNAKKRDINVKFKAYLPKK